MAETKFIQGDETMTFEQARLMADAAADAAQEFGGNEASSAAYLAVMQEWWAEQKDNLVATERVG